MSSITTSPDTTLSAEPVMLPASFAQELLWLMHRAAPESTSYNVPRVRRLKGKLNEEALRRSFDALVARHEILRTTYASHGEQVVQVVHAPRSVPFDIVDVTDVAIDLREATVDRAVRQNIARPFDLARDLLLRVTLYRMTADDNVLLIESHHVAFDGVSRDILFRELDAIYSAFAGGRTPELPELPIQYADFAIWQREELAGSRLASLIDYWRGALDGASFSLELPTDRPRLAAPSWDGASVAQRLDPALVAAITELARTRGATLYMALLGAYMSVLHRWTGQSDVLVGSPVLGRPRVETEGLIGYFANTVVQRGRFADDPTFAELLDDVRNSTLGAYDHQDIPFEKLVAELAAAQDPSRSPLFQVVFTQLAVATEGVARIGDVTLESFAVDAGVTKFDLTLLFSQRPAGVDLALRYRTDLFSSTYAERFLADVRAVLVAAVADPMVRSSTIPLLDADERLQIAAWNQTDVDEGTPATLVELFDAQASRVPARVAVVSGDNALTYRALGERANQLAHRLRELGVTRDTPVGLLLDRSADAIVGLVGILKAGGAYVPLAVDAPSVRVSQQLADSGVAVVVTSAALADTVPPGVTAVALDRATDAQALAALPRDNPSPVARPEDLAYVLFTSGSTGVPKGVAVTHANAVHYARAISRVLADTPATEPGDGLAALDGLHFGIASTLAADLGNTSLLPALLSGSTLHVLSKDVTTEPARFAEYARTAPLDVLKLTPNHLLALAAGRSGGELAAVLPRKWIVLGGEALRAAVVRTLLGAGTCRVLNHYGPTEATVGVLAGEVTSTSLDAAEAQGAASVPLGRPLSNTRAFVVDSHGGEQPVSVPGELWIGGAGVSRGYLHRNDLTAERFANLRGERVYRTGDRVRRLPDGMVEFLGRLDDQVKVRGFRVELGEIEHVLRAHPGVAQGTVVLHQNDQGDQQLVAYAVAQGGYAVSHNDRPTPEKLTEWLAVSLPAHMVPEAVVLLDALPLTPNGKVDRSRLPSPQASATRGEDEFVAPRTDTERTLAAIWADILQKSPIGMTDNFLALGGHSLRAIRVLGKISKSFGVRLPLRTLFDAPTVEQLAEVVELSQLESQIAAVEALSSRDPAGS